MKETNKNKTRDGDRDRYIEKRKPIILFNFVKFFVKNKDKFGNSSTTLSFFHNPPLSQPNPCRHQKIQLKRCRTTTRIFQIFIINTFRPANRFKISHFTFRPTLLLNHISLP
ncbi:hypothetical protein PRUPE_8G263000 [Prunus persica]|uniref:Uncharacterized protein n=1 Tax=Prunus persica TaxID=3760 RepID=A0A251N3N3_PRUPE|nr:hypothetical protein PRUPE_8G263000 [Prunus persica]